MQTQLILGVYKTVLSLCLYCFISNLCTFSSDKYDFPEELLREGLLFSGTEQQFDF